MATKKRTLFHLIILWNIFIASAQNLVPNPGFETYTSCPNDTSYNINLTTPWFQPTAGTTDYFNTCDLLGSGPGTLWYQPTTCGCNQGYAGFFVYESMGSPNLAEDYREYMEVQLTSPLVKGQTYSVEFYINLWNSSEWAIDRIGAHFSVSSLTNGTSKTLNVTPQVSSPAGITMKDTLAWMLVSSCFVADSAYNYITIGHFQKDANTVIDKVIPEYNQYQTGYNAAFYFVDDVSVIPSSDNSFVDVSVCGDSILCSTYSVTLIASSGSTYLWNTGATTKQISATPSVTTTYNITAKNTCGISSSDFVTIVVNPMPTAYAGVDITICEGSGVQLNATGGNTYSWSPSLGLNNSGISNPIAAPVANTVYIVNVGIGNCFDQDTLVFVVHPSPVIIMSANATVCYGTTLSLIASGADNYAWQPLIALNTNTGTTVIANPTSTIIYSVSATSPFGCEGNASVTIKVNQLPLADAGQNITIETGENATLIGEGGLFYSWIPANGLSCNTCKVITAGPQETTGYYLTVTDENGCMANDSVVVTIVIPEESIYMPNSFTPNEDGKNDIFYIYGSRIKTIEFNIFDRWGQLLFSSNNIQQGWNGTHKNKPCKEDVYICTVNYTWPDNQTETFTDQVVLIR